MLVEYTKFRGQEIVKSGKWREDSLNVEKVDREQKKVESGKWRVESLDAIP